MKKTALSFLSLFLFISVVWTCVNDCSNHGTCSSGVCLCNNGYGGEDCSVLDTALTSGVPVTGNLKTYQWHYYHISVPSNGDSLIIQVNQTSRLGDVDVYVKLGSYPNGNSYNTSDTSDSNKVTLTVNPADAGVWYIGLYGFWDVSYNISATVNVNCNPACVNGVCSNHVCTCFEPYFGDDCSIYDLEVTSGRTYYGVVETQHWIYYHIDVQAGQYLKVELNQAHPAPYDLDLYLKYNQRPSMWSFNYINATTEQTTILIVETPQVGLWEIGLYGYYGDSYSIVATAAAPPPSVCQNNCSGETHGTCKNSICTCKSNYVGPSCSNYTSNLQLDTVYSGYVASAQWNYYHILFFTSGSLQISVTQGDQGDVDLYVRVGDYPSRVVYTYADLTIHKSFTVNITAPGDETWYLGFYGWIPASYSFSISQVETCSCSNSAHGTCPQGSTICECNLGWAGYQCSQISQHITSAQVLSYQSVAKNGWNYYYITCNTHAVIITMVETSTSGFLWLFVSETGYPELDNFSEANYQLSDYHEIAITYDQAVDRILFIGVYGGSTITTDDSVVYSITAWASPL